MAGDEPDEDPRDDELDLVRQALDYTPNEVLRDLADEDDADLLASIDERLDRIVIEEVEVEGDRVSPASTEPEDGLSVEDETTEPAEEPLEASEEPDQDDLELDERDVNLEVVLGKSDAAEDEDDEEADTPVEVVVAEDEGDEDAETEGNVEVVVAEQPVEGSEDEPEDDAELAREALASADPAPPSSAPWPDEGNGHGPEAEVRSSPYDVLNSFTVVAPPTGSIEGEWSVAGEETVPSPAGGSPQWTSEEEDLDLGLEDEPGDEADEEIGVGLEEDLFGDEEPGEDELLAEAEPEQELEDEPAEEVDDEFWEDLLEDEADEEQPSADEEPADDFEDEGFEDLWDEPVDEPAEETGEDEPADEDETFEDLWEDLDEEVDEGDESEPTTFEMADASGSADAGLEFEEVEFELAEPEPSEEPEDEPSETVRGTPAEEPAEAIEPDEVDEPEEIEAEATAEPEWPSEADEAGDEIVEADAPEPQDTGEGYTHGPYTLYHKVVETGQGEPRDLYFFARNPPEDADPSELPDGYEVGVNERTGVPFVREEDEA